MYGPHLVYLAGNLGSGKSTLARALSLAANWEFVPETSPPLDYLPDLFADPDRWALETQAAFLASKAETVRVAEGLPRGSFALIDRSVYEHFEVFVRAFHETGAINDRGLAMFARLQTQVISGLLRPGAVILCDAPPEICEDRIRARARNVDRLYPQGHVHRLGRYLSAWAQAFVDAPLLVFNSVDDDPRDPEVARLVREDVERVVLGARPVTRSVRMYDEGATRRGRLS